MAAVADAAVGGVTSAMGAIFILLAVGALIGTWNMAGTIPTVVDYGIRLVSPTGSTSAAAVVCALVGMVTGSSWTTAGTLGVAFVGMANVIGLDEAIAAGAVICGAYFGDKMTPLSETTILVPKLVGGGLTVGEHVRNMFWTAGPALGDQPRHLRRARSAPRTRTARSARTRRERRWRQRSTSPSCNLLPLLLLVVFAILKAPAVPVDPGVGALRRHPGAASSSGTRSRRSSTIPSLGPLATSIEAIYAAMATGFVSDSGVAPIDELFSRGGMASMLTTIWLVLGALSFAAVMEHAGFLQRLLDPIVSPDAGRRGSLIAAVNASGIGLNVIAGDQYVADVLPARMFRGEFARTRAGPAGAVAGGGGLGHRDVRARAVEHLRRLHLRRARRLHRRVPPVLLLQPAQPAARRPLRVHRLQGADHATRDDLSEARLHHPSPGRRHRRRDR